MSATDPKQYKETQRHSWDSVAHGWEKWWRAIEIGAGKVSKRLIELASIKIGSKVLDISTGIGEPAITAAREVGNTGQVLATDISSEMLSIAKQRAINAGLQNVIVFKQGDTGTIELSNSTFDAALCRFGLMFLPDLDTALLNIYSSLVNGGRFAAAVWASPEKDGLFTSTMNTIMKETHTSPPPAGAPGPFSLSDASMLRNYFVNAGFKDVTIERMIVTFDFASSKEYASFVHETAGPLHEMLSNESPDRRQKILEAVSESARKFADNTGIVKFSNDAICIMGQK
ncbi:MAG TPA: class I SAM-dependent methyltransferase [Nitrososphaeraceae archaeon]|nr:class I SAM-dependent methyltransferase [Nitrososphaeraceae archaeon]